PERPCTRRAPTPAGRGRDHRLAEPALPPPRHRLHRAADPRRELRGGSQPPDSQPPGRGRASGELPQITRGTALTPGARVIGPLSQRWERGRGRGPLLERPLTPAGDTPILAVLR